MNARVMWGTEVRHVSGKPLGENPLSLLADAPGSASQVIFPIALRCLLRARVRQSFGSDAAVGHGLGALPLEFFLP